jgi:hypothetical protein
VITMSAGLLRIPTKPRRAVTRVLRHVNRLVTPDADGRAVSGRQASTDMMRWAWAELAAMERVDPRRAEDARWHLARYLAAWAAWAPKGGFEHRAGVTEEEVASLLGKR